MSTVRELTHGLSIHWRSRREIAHRLVFPDLQGILHWSDKDRLDMEGILEERIPVFQDVGDDLEGRIEQWLSNLRGNIKEGLIETAHGDRRREQRSHCEPQPHLSQVCCTDAGAQSPASSVAPTP